MKNAILFSLGAASLMAVEAAGALMIDTTGTPFVIDFQSDVPNVFRAPQSLNMLMESQSPEWTNPAIGGFAASAWAYRQSNFNAGNGGGQPSRFVDYNNNGSLSDALNVATAIPGLNLVQNPVFGSAPNNWGVVLGNSNFTDGLSADMHLSLRIQNNTGAPVSQWQVSMDILRNADAPNTAVHLRILQTTGPWTPTQAERTTLLGVADAIIFDQIFANELTDGWVSVLTSSDILTINNSVLPGDFLYLIIDANNGGLPGSAGRSAFAIDNISVTAVPEPSTYALLFGLSALAFVLVRRRRARPA